MKSSLRPAVVQVFRKDLPWIIPWSQIEVDASRIEQGTSVPKQVKDAASNYSAEQIYFRIDRNKKADKHAKKDENGKSETHRTKRCGKVIALGIEEFKPRQIGNPGDIGRLKRHG